MNQKLKALLILIFMTISAKTLVYSQNDESDIIMLDINTAVELALEQNPLIRMSKLGIESAEAQYYETLGSFWPNISASGMYNNNLRRPVIFMPDEPPFFGQVLEIGSEHSYNAGFSGSIPVFNHALISSLRANRIQQVLSEEELREAKIELRYNVMVAFYNALLARESLEIMKQRIENSKENYANIKSMHKQGLVSEFDKIRAEVQTENLRPSLIQAENAYKLSLNFLIILTGIDKDEAVELEGDLVNMAEEWMINFDIQQTERSLAGNSGLIQLDIQRNLINQQEKAVRAANLPSVAAIGNYQFQSQANDLNFSDYDWVQTAAVGLQINIPIFDGFTTRNRARQLQITSEQLALQREYLEDNLSMQLSDIIRTISLAIEKAANAEKNVELAERAYKIALTRYDSGQGTLLEVNDSEIALSQAKFNYIQAIHEILNAKTEHEKFIGKRN